MRWPWLSSCWASWSAWVCLSGAGTADAVPVTAQATARTITATGPTLPGVRVEPTGSPFWTCGCLGYRSNTSLININTHRDIDANRPDLECKWSCYQREPTLKGSRADDGTGAAK